MSAQTFPRPIALSIARCNRPVAVVEGARAIGKTWIVKNLFVPRGFEYVDLSDQSVRRSAMSNPNEWLKRLSLPAIIDEAQLMPELPLLIKQAVDQITEPSLSFILTGSASIQTNELGLQDPLIRRFSSYKVDPLTRREVLLNSQNLVDDLWDNPPQEDGRYSVSREELYSYLCLGGFPRNVMDAGFTTQDEREKNTAIDIERILGKGVLPTGDAYSANSVLQYLLVKPGGILNVSTMSKDLGINRATANSYFTKLLNRYLVFSLPNLRLQPRRQAESRMKIHPTDTSFSMSAFSKSGINLMKSPDVFGELFESFVVNQFVPCLSWTQRAYRAFYWRDSKNTDLEVDLVLKANDGVMGVEVKSSTSVSSDDFKGLKALAQFENLKRGYLVYTGDRVRRFGENLWAIPVGSLWSKSAFPTREKQADLNLHFPYRDHRIQGGSVTANMGDKPSDANLFLSYNHADNEHLHNAMVSLLKDVVAEYEFAYGRTLALFTGIDSIPWGDDWKQILDRAIDATNFLLPQVTPRYIGSAACRDELFRFAEQEKGHGRRSLFPMIWQPIATLNLEAARKQARDLIEQYQYIDVTEMRYLKRGDIAYDQKVQEICEKLHDAIMKHVSEENNQGHSLMRPEQDTRQGLADEYPQVKDELRTLDDYSLAIKKDIVALGGAIAEVPPADENNPDSFARWAESLSCAANTPTDRLNEHVAAIEAIWPHVKSYNLRYIDFMKQSGDTVQLENLLPNLIGLREQFTLSPELRSAMNSFKVFQMLTSSFIPIVNSLTNCIDVFTAIGNDIDNAIDKIRDVKL